MRERDRKREREERSMENNDVFHPRSVCNKMADGTLCNFEGVKPIALVNMESFLESIVDDVASTVFTLSGARG